MDGFVCGFGDLGCEGCGWGFLWWWTGGLGFSRVLEERGDGEEKREKVDIGGGWNLRKTIVSPVTGFGL